MSAWLSRHKVIKRIASVTALFAFITSVTLSDAWAVIDKAGSPHERMMSSYSPAPSALLDPGTFTIPAYLGEIKEAWRATLDGPRVTGHGPRKTIIHIQDAHCNYAAQRRIAELIKYLNTQYDITTVNLEGGKGDYDLSVFTDIEDKKIREEVADYFVKEGLVSGAEYFAVNNPHDIKLWGVEDAGLYLESLNTYRDSLKYKERIDAHLRTLTHILNNLKRHIYTKELLELDTKYAQHKAGGIDFKDYASYIIGKAKRAGIDIEKFENIELLRETLAQEGGIDFKKANTERDLLIDRLHKILSIRELKELVLKTVRFKQKKTKPKDFYAYLVKKASDVTIGLNDYPELQKYIDYIATYEAADRSMVMKELELLEAELRSRLFKNDQQKELSLLSRHLALIKDLFNASLTRDDYRYYRDHEDQFAVANFIAFIRKEAPVHKITAELDEDVNELDRYREKFSEFYEYSFKRDKAFINNIRFPESKRQTSPRHPEPSPRHPERSEGSLTHRPHQLRTPNSELPLDFARDGSGGGELVEPRTTILITGGFHAENLCALFRENNISYVSIRPSFTSAEGYECPYFRLLAGTRDPAEEKFSSVLFSSIAFSGFLNEMGAISEGQLWCDFQKMRARLEAAVEKGHEGLILKNGDKEIAFKKDPEGNPEVVFPDKNEKTRFMIVSAEDLGLSSQKPARTGWSEDKKAEWVKQFSDLDSTSKLDDESPIWEQLNFADRETKIEIAKLCAQSDGGGTAVYFKNFGLDPEEDRKAIIEIAKLCAQSAGRETAIYFENFGLDPEEDRKAIIEIVKLCAQSSGKEIVNRFEVFGLDRKEDKVAIIEIVKLCAQSAGMETAQCFKSLGLDRKEDKVDIIKIAKLCAQSDGGCTAVYFKNFGLDPEEDKVDIIEIAKLCARSCGGGTAQYFKNFGLDPEKDKAAIIEIAKLCARSDGMDTACYFKNFGLDPEKDKAAIIEIACLCAQQNGKWTVCYFKQFGLDPKEDKQAIIGTAKMCAQQNGEWTAEYFKQFGLDPKEDKQAIKEIAVMCARQNGRGTAKHLKEFELNYSWEAPLSFFLNHSMGLTFVDQLDKCLLLDPKEGIVQLAGACAQDDGGMTAQYFKKFGLDPRQDKPETVKIAKLCARQDGRGTAKYFNEFGLDPEEDMPDIIEIAKLCAERHGEIRTLAFQNFGLGIEDDESIMAGKERDDAIQSSLNLFRFMMKSPWTNWTRKQMDRVEESLKNGDQGIGDLGLEAFYDFLRDEKLFYPEEEMLAIKGDNEFVSVDARVDNIKLLNQKNLLIQHNNEAMKLAGKQGLKREEAFQMIAHVEKMLEIFEKTFMKEEAVRVKLKEIRNALSKNKGPLEKNEKQLLMQCSGKMHSLQDVIIYLHQKCVNEVFRRYKDCSRGRGGVILTFKRGEIEGQTVVDISSLDKKERRHSGVKFFREFCLSERLSEDEDNDKHYRVPFSCLGTVLGLSKDEEIKDKYFRAANSLVAGKEIYQYFLLGDHEARLAMDMHSPRTGGHLMFEYNESSFDRERAHVRDGDVSGNDIRLLIVKRAMERLGFRASEKGQNVHAVYNQENGASSVQELVEAYERVYRVLEITLRKMYYLIEHDKAKRKKYGDSINDFEDTTLGETYRALKDRALGPDKRDEGLIEEMVEYFTGLIEKNVEEHIAKKRSEEKQAIENLLGKKGAATGGGTVLDALEKLYQQKQPKTPPERTLERIFSEKGVFSQARRIGAFLENIKDMLVWDTELEIGRYELKRSELEIGYREKDILYVLEDRDTGKAVLGWSEEGPAREAVLDSGVFHRRVKEEGHYPIGKSDGKVAAEISKEIVKEGLMQKFMKKDKRETFKETQGLSVSAGTNEGELVFYKRGKHKAEDLAGRIVVVKNLTPEDDEAVRKAAGLVLLGGGPLSHGAIFAMEMGIPAVIITGHDHRRFKVNGKRLEGYYDRLKRTEEEIDFASARLTVTRFIHERPRWIIEEGDILQISGEEGKIKEVSEKKKDIVRLLKAPDKNMKEIISRVTGIKELREWLYEKAYRAGIGTLIKRLEETDKSLIGYGKSLDEERRARIKESVKKEMDALKDAEERWRVYRSLAVIRKLLSGLDDAEEVKRVEGRLTDLLKGIKAVAVKQEDRKTAPRPEEAASYYDLPELGDEWQEVVGNKAAKLGELFKKAQKTGIAIPAGVGLSGEMSERFYGIPVEGRSLREKISEVLEGKAPPKEKSKRIAELFEHEDLRKSGVYADLREEMEWMYGVKWGDKGVVDDDDDVYLAVRSSAIRKGGQLEDVKGAAGLYESYMFVKKEELFDRVVDVWKALYSEKAIKFYTEICKVKEKGWRRFVEELQMGVVVQEQIDSDVSGVAFSADPSTGRDNAVVTACLFQGEGLVQGTVDADTYKVDRNGRIVEKNIAEKKEAMVKKEGKKELEKVNVIECMLPDSVPHETQKVLFVCTGNTCRSAMAEGLLRDIMSGEKGVEIRSAGIRTCPDDPASKDAIKVLRKEGIDISGYRSRRLSKEDINAADLVICMTGRHMEEALKMSPASREKTYLLTDFGDGAGNENTDVVDPYMGGEEAYQRCCQQIKEILPNIRTKVMNEVRRSLYGQLLEKKIKAPALTNMQVRKIARMARRLEKEFGYPVDTEIAVTGGSVYLVQVRMINSLGIDEGKRYFEELMSQSKVRDTVDESSGGMPEAKPAAPGAGARKDIADREMRIDQRTKENLVQLAGDAAGSIPENSDGCILVNFTSTDKTGIYVKEKGLPDAFNFVCSGGATYIFVNSDRSDSDEALRHEQLEIDWSGKLETAENKAKLAERGLDTEKDIPKAAHILAWGQQIAEQGWEKAEDCDFVKEQLAGMDIDQLERIITEDRKIHRQLREMFLTKDDREKVERFEQSARAMVIYEAMKRLVPGIVEGMRKAHTYVLEPVVSAESEGSVFAVQRAIEQLLGKNGHNIHGSSYSAYGDRMEGLKTALAGKGEKKKDSILRRFYTDVTSYAGTRMVIRLVSRDGNSCANEEAEIREFIEEELLKLINEDGKDLTDNEKANMAREIARDKVKFVPVHVGEAKYLNTDIDLFTDIVLAECDRYRKDDVYPGQDIPRHLAESLDRLLRLSIANYGDLVDAAIIKNEGKHDMAAIVKTIFAGYVLAIRALDWEKVKSRIAAYREVLRAL